MAELTPMMKQYLEIKKQHENCILFFRLGDFYEMFFDDAKTASQELELVLTGRDCGQEERAPMCGVPFHSCESYIARLVAKGYKVAICEQMEDPALAQGLVKRDVVRIITPGTVIEGSMLDEGKNNYLSVLYMEEGAAQAGLCFCDCSTGDIHLTCLRGEDVPLRVANELGRYAPSEILLNQQAAGQPAVAQFVTDRLGLSPDVTDDSQFDYDDSQRRILAHFGKDTLEDLGLENQYPAVRALGCALSYLQATQMTGLERLTNLDVYSDVQFMRLDVTARRNLELLETMRSTEKRGSLLGVLDCTKTAMGKRLIRSWIEQPLIHPAQIIRRHNAVEELLGDMVLRGDVRTMLADIYDLERIMTRIVYGSANARELRSLSHTIASMTPVKSRLEGVKSALLQEIQHNIDPLEDVAGRIAETLCDEPPFSVREGGLIRDGYHAELDQLRDILSGGKGFLTELEQREKEKTGIRTLKVGYNKVFGYYIEISNAFRDQVPEDYIRKQTLVNGERYITQELKELEHTVLTASDRAAALEYELFTALRQEVAAQGQRIQSCAAAVAELDALCSLAEVAVRNRYCRPEVDESGVIEIHGGRHPVVEQMLSDALFVPNDTFMGAAENRVAIITGPNMAGKSTYMRQVALIVLLAQMGSFVPASAARIGLVDRIFTRIGASDDLSGGRSTFMVEMSEVSEILREATPQSLLILDEIGRGTSTFDGESLAQAVLEYCADRKTLGARTLFATHYHELTELEGKLPGTANFNIAVKARGDEIIFLRKILPGGADRSYGIEVAKLAGIPEKVLKRARTILTELESQSDRPRRESAPQEQMTLGNAREEEVLDALRRSHPDALTPLEAMQLLYELKKKLE